MQDYRKIKAAIGIELAAVAISAAILGTRGMWDGPGYLEPAGGNLVADQLSDGEQEDSGKKKDYIKWVEFNVTNEAMRKAYQYDIDTYGKDIHLSWVDLLAFLGAKYGGDFSGYQEEDMDDAAEILLKGEKTLKDLTEGMEYYDYYR